jgi:ubiquinone biosynthesis protein UbiJ
MNLCDSGHDEVCYSSRSCPVCAKIDDIKELQDEIEDLKKDIERLEEDL